MIPQLNALLLNHTSANLVIRELLSFDDVEVQHFLNHFQAKGIDNLLLISTCNRTEIYFDEGIENSEKILAYIKDAKKVDAAILSQFEYWDDYQKIITHLFRTSMGLESAVFGDYQIYHQVKSAYQATVTAQLASTTLHRLMHSIFYAHKRIVKETDFKTGIASTAFAVADIVRKKSREFVNPKILVVGAGNMGRDVVKNLTHLLDSNLVTISNRTCEKAEELVEKHQVSHLKYESLYEQINNYDIIVFAVEVNENILDSQHIHISDFRHKYIFDLRVPRAVHSNVADIPSVILYNIDEIQSQLSVNQHIRENAVRKVEKILIECIEDYFLRSEKIMVSPAIKKLKVELEHIREQELEEYIGKHEISNALRKNIDEITQGLMKKVLNHHIVKFNTACKRGEPNAIVSVINELFNVEEVKAE